MKPLSLGNVYVGTYEKYNNGSLKGDWLELDDYTSKEDFLEACKELHKDEQEPEFMFQDWEEDDFGGITESSVDEQLWEIPVDEYKRMQVFVLIEEGYTLSQALKDYENVQIIECDYKHEVPATYFDYYCKMIGITDDNPLLPYVDEECLWNACGRVDFTFIKGIGLVNTNF